MNLCDVIHKTDDLRFFHVNEHVLISKSEITYEIPLEILFDKLIVIEERQKAYASEFKIEWEKFPLFSRWFLDVITNQMLHRLLKNFR